MNLLRGLIPISLLAVSVGGYCQTPALQWVGVGNGDNTKYFTQVAVDNSGNVYTAGGFFGNFDADLSDGEHMITSVDQDDGMVIKTNSAGQFQWVRTIPGTDSQRATTVNIDANGDIVVGGYYMGDVDFDPGGEAEYTADEETPFLMKLSPAGDLIWVRIFPNDEGIGSISSVAIDKANNNIFVAGLIQGKFDSDPGIGISLNESVGAYDIWIAKFNPNSTYITSVSTGGLEDDYVEQIMLDGAGQLVVRGIFSDDADLDPGIATAPFTAAGNDGDSDVFILKLDNSLAFQWAGQIASQQPLSAGGLAIDPSNDIILNGTFYDQADFDPDPSTEFIVSGVNGDFFITKWKADGSFGWAVRAGSLGYETGEAIAVDDSGNIYVTGKFDSNFDINPDGAVEEIIPFRPDGYDLYFAKFDNDGHLLWHQPIPTGDIGSVVHMTIDSDDNIYFVGDWNGEIDFSTNTCVDGKRATYDNALPYVVKYQVTSSTACFGFLEQPVATATGCESEEVILSAPAGGTTHITYQWQMFDGTTWDDLHDQEFDSDNGYEGTSTPYLKIYPVEGGASGDIRCMANGDGVSTIYSNTVAFTIIAAPPLPGVVATSGCGPGNYKLEAFGQPAVEYQWHIDGILVDGVTGNELTHFFDQTSTVTVSQGAGACQGDGALVIVNTNACAQPPGLLWANKLSPGLIEPTSMDVGPGNELYIAGQFYETADFDTGSDVFNMTPNGSSDYFIAKYSDDGVLIWAIQTDATIYDIVVGTGGQVYYTGNFEGTVDFDPGPTTFNMTVNGSGKDIMIVKLGFDGSFGWAQQLVGTVGESQNLARAIANGDGDNVYITGNFQRTVDFDPDPVDVANLTSATSTGHDIFVAKYSEDGNYRWARRMGSTAQVERGYDIAVDGAGFVYTVGVFQTTVDFDPDPAAGAVAPLTSLGNTEGFIQQLTSDGLYSWAKRIGGTGTDDAVSLDIDNFDRPVVGGHFAGTVNFDTDGSFPMTAGSQPSFIVKFESDGSFSYANQVGGSITKLFADGPNNVLITGNFENSIDIDPGPEEYILETAVTADVYVAYLGVETLFWGYNTNASGLQYFQNQSTGVAIDSNGDIYVAGFFNNSLDLDPTNCTYPLLSEQGDGRITFMQKISPGVASLCFPLEPADVIECDGGDAVLTAQATGTTNIVYQWYRFDEGDGSFIAISPADAGYSGADGPELTVRASTLGGAYRVQVSGDLVGNTTSDAVAVSMGTTPAPPTFTPVSFCSPGEKTLTVSGGTNGNYQWYEALDAEPIEGLSDDTFTTPFIDATTTYYVRIFDGPCMSDPTTVEATFQLIDPPAATGAASCFPPASLTLTATGAGAGEYRWYQNFSDADAIAGETNDSYVTPSLSTTTTYYVAINNGSCESTRVPAEAKIGSKPAPATTDAERCGPGAITLTATGGLAGEYKWYTQASGGTAITGETDDTFVTPSITTTTQYFVSVDDGSCESTRTPVNAVINVVPAAPTSNGLNVCTDTSATLTATSATAGELQWYEVATGGVHLDTGPSFETPVLTTTTIFHVSVFDTKCESERTSVTVTVTSCANNQPPVIAPHNSTINVGTTLTVSLGPLLSDPDNNLDLATLKIITQPASGAVAVIDQNGKLVIDYSSTSFIGDDELTIEVCDIAGSCTTATIKIRVEGDMMVYNAISPNGDGKNDVWHLGYIDAVADTKDNRVTIFNRWGDVVFDIDNYNNTTNVFTGKSNAGKELPSGTYYYKIEFQNGRNSQSGYLSLKR